MKNGERLSPIPLAGKKPVAKLVIDSLLPFPFFNEPIGSFFLSFFN